MERIKRNNYIAQVTSLLGKGEAVVLTGHRRAGKSCILELLSDELSVDLGWETNPCGLLCGWWKSRASLPPEGKLARLFQGGPKFF